MDEEITDAVFNKYQMAGKIADDIMNKILDECVTGADIQNLCKKCDEWILNETSKIYKKVKFKGIAHPTTISVNHNVNGFSNSLLFDGDMVKVYFALHIDGYPVHTGKTLIIGKQNNNLVKATSVAAEVLAHIIKPGFKSRDASNILDFVAHTYGCKKVQYIVTHESFQHILRGERYFPGENFKFETNEVYNIDVAFTEGTGEIKDNFEFPLYYRTDKIHMLKTKAGRQTLEHIHNTHGNFPFNITDYEDYISKLGIQDCIKNELIEQCEAFYEKTKSNTARFSFTVILMDTGLTKITSHSYDKEFVQNNDILRILNHPLKTLEELDISG